MNDLIIESMSKKSIWMGLDGIFSLFKRVSPDYHPSLLIDLETLEFHKNHWTHSLKLLKKLIQWHFQRHFIWLKSVALVHVNNFISSKLLITFYQLHLNFIENCFCLAEFYYKKNAFTLLQFKSELWEQSLALFHCFLLFCVWNSAQNRLWSSNFMFLKHRIFSEHSKRSI